MSLAAVAILLAVQAAGGPAPPTGHAPQITVTAPPPADAVELRKVADQIQEMYDQTCAAREWGAYDDMCDGIRKQVKDARATADRAERDAARGKRAAAAPP